MDWYNLLNRSYFSWNKGLFSPEEIVKRAARAGQKAVGLADLDNWSGVVRFIQAANKKGIKPIPGVILTFMGEKLVCAFPKNRQGLALINRILTNADLDPQWNPLSGFSAGWDGLILIGYSLEILESLIEFSKDDLFIAVPWGLPYYDNIRWAKKNGIPLFALHENLWESSADRQFFRLLTAIRENTYIENITIPLKFDLGAIQSEDSLLAFYSSIPEAVVNQQYVIEASIGAEFIYSSFQFPRFKGLSEEKEREQLIRLCRQGVARRYGQWNSQVNARLDYELNLIYKKGFAGYFLVVQDIVSHFPRTCGRGSAAASIVSYLLGITHVDPLRNNLFFERFLNEGRKDPPDIDIDFPWDERDKALQYVFTEYAGQVGMVADHVTYADRSCFRAPAKAFGMAQDEIQEVLRAKNRGEWSKIPDYILNAAHRLQGMPNFLGTHPGGIVITPGPIFEIASITQSPSGIPVIPWEKDAAEEAGLVKIDLLGNRSLGVLRDAIALVNQEKEEVLDWETFQPYDDTSTRDLIEEGDTLGVFYIESPATRQLLKKMQTGRYEDLVIASSIIRPAANAYINEFVARLKGKEWMPLHPLAEEPLKETCGIMVYQEDVSRVAMSIAGFSAAQADGLRKVLSKKDRLNRLETYKDAFIQGGVKKGISKDILEKYWEMILSFDGYSFSKAHSASYALLSYRLAYIKKRYPLIFYTSVLNNGGGFYHPQVYCNALRRLPSNLLRPDINKSQKKYSITHQGVQAGLSLIKNLSSQFIERILSERNRSGAFRDFRDFMGRLQPSLAEIRPLIKSGALDSISGNYTRPQLFWVYHNFDRNELLWELPSAPDNIKDYSSRIKLIDEVDQLGLFLSQNPINVFLPRIPLLYEKQNLPPLKDTKSWKNCVGHVVALAGMSIVRKYVRTKYKEEMSFVSFEDDYGIFETVFFPAVWNKYHLMLDEFSAFLVIGRVVEEWDTLSLQVEYLHPLSNIKRSSIF